MYVSAHDVVVHYASLGHQVGDRRECEHEREHHLCPSEHGPNESDGSCGGGGGWDEVPRRGGIIITMVTRLVVE